MVPEGIESVNGSSETMGCTSPLEESGGVTVCRSQSYLVDGCSPDIDTSTSDWASHLVTVKRVDSSETHNFSHVLLTFGFETAVTLTAIEMDLFLCPDWGIGAPHIIVVYLKDDRSFNFDPGLHFHTHNMDPAHSSCDSLSTVVISGDIFSAVQQFHTMHILIDLPLHLHIEWVHLGDVRFIGS